MIRTLSVLVAALTASISFAGPAAADPADVFRDETTGSSSNLCNGDSVDLVGRLQILSQRQGDSLRFHVTFHAQGSGVPSGDAYVLALNDHVVFAPGDTTERFRANLISKGDGPNFVSVIVDRDGNLQIEQECRG